MTSTARPYPTIEVGGSRGPIVQTVVNESARGRIIAVGTAYDVAGANRERDVTINASYSGVLPARFIGECAPRATIGVDCAIGRDGAGIAGLWYLEALGIPAAAADVQTLELGNGIDMYESGVISVVNQPARGCGVRPRDSVRGAAHRLLEGDPVLASAAATTNRTTMRTAPDGRAIVCTDSIAFGLPEDCRRNVLCTAGHTGISAVSYLRAVQPRGFICSDGGRGKNDAGIAALAIVQRDGLPGATVDARTARMGDGLSTYHDGEISACNELARDLGIQPGEPAADAAWKLLTG